MNPSRWRSWSQSWASGSGPHSCTTLPTRGTITDEDRYAVLGGETEAIAQRLEEDWAEGWDLFIVGLRSPPGGLRSQPGGQRPRSGGPLRGQWAGAFSGDCTMTNWRSCWAERMRHRDARGRIRRAGPSPRYREGNGAYSDGLGERIRATCTPRGQRRLSPDEVAGYLFRRWRVVWSSNASWRMAPACTSMSAATPRTSNPRTRRHLRAGGARQGGGVDPLFPGRGAGARPREEGIRGTSTCSRTHRLGGQLCTAAMRTYLTLARDFAHYTEVLIPFLAGRQAYAGAERSSRPPGARAYCLSQRAEQHPGGRLVGHHPQPTDHQHPREPTPMRRSTAGSM